MITAPYNFVPLNKEVFYPDWDRDISLDVPFEDAESSIIEVKITARSPIFIRNHYEEGDEYYEQKKENGKVKVSKEFCHYKEADGAKQFYIPGSSFKGMLRNFIEIMSFAEIRIDKEKHSKPFSVRDMTPKQYCTDPKIRGMKHCPDNKRQNLFSHDIVATAQKCGMLSIQKDGSGVLEDCGKVINIHHMELKNNFSISGVKNCETAQQKYKKFGHKEIDVDIKKMGRQQKAVKGSGKRGFLVFTGDITGKKHEFVFIRNGNKKQVSAEVIKRFKTVYFDDASAVDGQYWKKEHKSRPIPVFYTTDRNGNIRDIGLTQIFKLAYNKSIADAAKQHTQNGRLDLATLIFGIEREGDALKGRVYCSHLKSTLRRYESTVVQEVLGEPKPSYYPNYVRQTDIQGNKVRQYKTFMDEDAQIAGWKQYPLQNGIQHYELPKKANDEVNTDVATEFKPLGSGTVFKGKIRFHNLKKAEIGALISALTFHGEEHTHLHTIGMAKPLGYGKITVEVGVNSLLYDRKVYLDAFEELMDTWEKKEYKKWRRSVLVESLFAMHNIRNERSLKYQTLDNKNEFAEAKKSREYLKPYSEFSSTEKKKITQQKKDNTNKKQNSASSKSQHPTGISKTKMRKAITEYWKDHFGIFYHPNQIKEFLQESFETTPEEQREVYLKRKDDTNFVALVKLIDQFNNNKMSDALKEKLYKTLTRNQHK